MTQSNLFAERPLELDQNWNPKYHDHIMIYVQGREGRNGSRENPEQYSVEQAKVDLIDEARQAEDARLFFNERCLTFAYTATGREAVEALYQNSSAGDGFWLAVLDGILAKPIRDGLDYDFLARFGHVIQDARMYHSDIPEPVEITQRFDPNVQIFDGASDFVSLYSINLGNDAQFMGREYETADRAAKKLGLPKEQHQYLRDLVASRVIRAFTAIRRDGGKVRSSTRLYHDVGRCEGGSIDMDRRGFWIWVTEIDKAITQLSHGDTKRRRSLTAMVVRKVVRDITYELPRVEDLGEPGKYYDAVQRKAVIGMLRSLGLTREQRHSVYDRIPGFFALPREEQVMLFGREDLLPDIRDEFEDVA
jgi:hypothetical protein